MENIYISKKLANLINRKILLLSILFLTINFTAVAQTCTINAGDLNFRICEGVPFNFTGQSLSPPNQTTWTQISGPSVVIDDVNNAQSGVLGMLGGNTYVFSFSANCNTLTQEVTVIVEPITEAEAGMDIEFCPDTMGNISVTGNTPLNTGETGSWQITSGSNPAGVVIDFPTSETTTLTIPATSCGTTTISWIIEGPEYAPGLRCRSQSDILITNYGGVQPVDAGFDQTLGNCYTTTTSTLLDATFGGCSLNGQVGAWSFVSGPNIPAFVNINNSDTRINGLIEGTYILRWSVGGPCSDASDEVTITVPAATQDVTGVGGPRRNFFICDNGVNSITLDGAQPQFAGETVLWTQIGGAGLPPGSIQSPTSPTTVINNLSDSGDPYTFRYRLTNSNTGCDSFRDYRVQFRGSSRTIEANSGNDIFGACGQTNFNIPLATTGTGFNRYQIVSGPAGSALGPFPTTLANSGGVLNIDLITEGTYVIQFLRTEGGELPLGCSDGFDTINVTVSANTNTPNAGLDFSVNCGDVSTNLVGNIPTAGTPIWSQISGPNTVTFVDPFQITATINGLIPGAYEFQYTFQGGGSACPIVPSTVMVNISGAILSTSATGPDQTVCFNAPAYMAANQPAAGEIGTWTEDPGNPNTVTFSDINDPNAIITGFSAPSSTYVFTWTIDYISPGSSGCATPSGNNITITTLATETPTVANAGSDGCFSSGVTSINLGGNATAAVGETGLWTVVPSSGVTFSPNANTPNATATIPGDGAYTFTWSISDDSGTCGVTMDDVVVVVADNAMATAGTATVDNCSDIVNLNATLSNGATGEWSYVSGPGGFSFDDINAPNTNVNLTANGTYTFEWTVTAGDCSTDSAQVTINVGIPPTTANAGPDQSICNATNVVMGANSFDPNTEIGTWSLLSGAPNNPNIGNANNPNINITGLITGTYTFRWTITGIANPLCSESFDDVIIEVHAPANAGSNQNLCDVTSIFLEGTENSTGTWTQLPGGPGGATIVQSPANGPIANVDLSATPAGTYVFQYETDPNTDSSCLSTTDTVQVIVSATPSFDPDAGPDQDICIADTMTAVMSGNTPPTDGTTAEWIITFGPNTGSTPTTPTTIPANDESNPNAQITGFNTPGIYVLEWTFTNGNCVKLADVVRVEVFAAPTPIIAGPAQPNACQLDFMTNATFPTVGLGTWTITTAPDGIPSATTINSPNNPITGMSNILVGTYELTWTVSNGPFVNPSSCEPQPDTVLVTFNDIPPTEAEAGENQVLCSATQASLGATAVTSGIGTWTLVNGPNTPTITALNNPNSIVLGLITGTYEFRWTTTTTGNDGCSFEDTVTIEVVEDPLTSEAGPNQCIPEFSTLTLGATPASAGMGTWAQVSGPTTVGFVNANNPTTSVTGAGVGIYVFEWSVDNGSCDPVSDQVTIEIKSNADLELTKTVMPASANVGDEVTFSIEIFNNNILATNADATGVIVEDILPAGFDLVAGSLSPVGNFDLGSKTIQWSNLNIANGARITLEYRATVNAIGPYTNSAQITGSNQFDPDSDPATDDTVDEDGDGNPDDDDEDSVTLRIESADLSLSKIVAPSNVSVGDTVIFTINILNAGTDTATNVEVVDQLPAGYTYASDNSGGNYNPTTGLWLVGDVTTSGTSIEITAIVNSPTGATNEYVNVAEITASDQADPNTTPNNDDGDQSEDDEDNAGITLENADLALTKTISPTSGNIGDTVTFTIVVENIASAISTGDATGISVEDILPSGYTLVSGSISSAGNFNVGSSTISWDSLAVNNGDSIALTYQATVNNSGNYLNIAQITGSDLPDPNSTPDNDIGTENDQDEAIFTIEEIELSLEKRTNPVLTSTVIGSTVTFEIEVSNAGTAGLVDATGVQIQDLLPSGYELQTTTISNGGISSFDRKTITWNNLLIPSGGSIILSYDVIINAPTGSPDEYKNVAQVTAADQNDNGSTPNNDDGDQNEQDEDSETLPTPEIADLSLTKNVSNTNPNVGDVVTFSININNAGPNIATNVSIEDVLPVGYSNPTLISNSGTANVTGDIVSWSLTNVALGDTTLTFDATVNAPTGAVNEYINDVEITASDQFDPDSDPTSDADTDDNGDGIADDDEASVGVVIQESDLSIAKSIDNSSPNVGDTVTFTLTITNVGPDVATGVSIEDILPNGYTLGTVNNGGTPTGNTATWTGLTVASNNGTTVVTYEATVNAPGVGVSYTNSTQITASDQYDPDSDPTTDNTVDEDGDGNGDDDDEDTLTIAPAQADLSLIKRVVDGDVTPLVGSEITFEITVFNDGPQNATSVDVMDLLPSGYDFVLYSSTSGVYNETTGLWSIGTVLSGESETLLIDVLVNATGDYLNITEVITSDVFDIDSVPDNDDGDQSEDDEDSAIVTPVASVSDLSLVKTVVDNDVTPLVGSEITFQITVTNDGPEAATGVSVTDLLPSGYDFVLFSSTSGAYDEITGLWNIGGIANGESETLLIDVLVNASGDYLNIAQVTSSDILDSDSVPNNDDGDQSEDDEDNAIVTPVISVADLSLTKDVVDGDTSPLVGTEITFIITVTNDGPENATGVEVTDLLPSGFDYILFSSTSGTYDETTGIWNVGNIANGTTETLLIDALVNGTGDYLNIAQISASDVVDNDSAPNNDDGDQSEDDEDNVLVSPVDAMADLSLSKIVVDNEIMPNVGDEITFQIIVSNAGPDAATGVEVIDLLPQGFDFVRFSATSGLYDDVTGLWTVGTVPNASSQSLFIDVIINEPTGTTGEYLNVSEITASDVIDPNSIPNNDDGDQSEDDEDSILVMTETADLSLTKSVSNMDANVGDIVTFTLQIDNAGADAATGVSLEDILPIGYSNIINISDGGELIGNIITWSGLNVPLTGLTITYNATVNMPTLADDEYLNIAQIIGSDQFDPNSIPDNDDGDQSEDDEDSIFINTPIIDIAVTKTVDNANPSIGDTIVFTIGANNLGGIDATSVEIIDVLPSGYEFISSVASSGIYNEESGLWIIPLVSAGATETLEITVTVLDINDYVNTASLEFLDQIDSDETNDTDDATIQPQCLIIYNEFSPNGNGKNEFFYIDCINNYPNNKLEIYNRWGNLVYSKEGYDNTFAGVSNGRAVLNKEEKLPVGTYYYVLDLGDGSKQRAGWLYIVR